MTLTLRRNWFMVLLATILLIGISFPLQLRSFAESLPRDWIIGSVLFAMAMPLEFGAFTGALRKPLPILLAIAINWLLIPALAWAASQFLLPDLAIGLIIAAAVPCTLASASVWTRMAGGNETISLMVTVVTNFCCFFATPAIIEICSGKVGVEISFTEIAQKLLLLIVLPLLAAQLLRRTDAIAEWATKNKNGLSIYSQVGLLSIVFLGAVHCGMKVHEIDNLSTLSGQLLLLLALAGAVHLVAWLCGYSLAGQLGIERPEQIAVAFSGSQKTLMVGLAIALQFGGLAILPMLAYHVEQLLIDTVLANRLRAQ